MILHIQGGIQHKRQPEQGSRIISWTSADQGLQLRYRSRVAVHEKSALSYRRTQRDAARKEPIRCDIAIVVACSKKPNVVGQMTAEQTRCCGRLLSMLMNPRPSARTSPKPRQRGASDMLQAKLKN